MEKLFSVTIGKKRNEFSVVGVANAAKKTVKFQGLLNGIPFTQSKDYDRVRARVLYAVKINSPDTNGDAS